MDSNFLKPSRHLLPSFGETWPDSNPFTASRGDQPMLSGLGLRHRRRLCSSWLTLLGHGKSILSYSMLSIPFILLTIWRRDEIDVILFEITDRNALTAILLCIFRIARSATKKKSTFTSSFHSKTLNSKIISFFLIFNKVFLFYTQSLEFFV